jgi:hypothetical protein
MRTILAVVIIATFVLVVGPWSIHSTVADARPNVAKSIDPSVMMSNAPEMRQYVGP